MAIDPAMALLQFASSSPELHRAIEELKTTWAPDVPPNVIAMATVGRALTSMIECGEKSTWQRPVALIETFLADGDESTQNAVATGLLEVLLGAASSGRLDFRRVASSLGPLGRQFCIAWDEFTGCRTEGLD